MLRSPKPLNHFRLKIFSTSSRPNETVKCSCVTVNLSKEWAKRWILLPFSPMSCVTSQSNTFSKSPCKLVLLQSVVAFMFYEKSTNVLPPMPIHLFIKEKAWATELLLEINLCYASQQNIFGIYPKINSPDNWEVLHPLVKFSKYSKIPSLFTGKRGMKKTNVLWNLR